MTIDLMVQCIIQWIIKNAAIVIALCSLVLSVFSFLYDRFKGRRCIDVVIYDVKSLDSIFFNICFVNRFLLPVSVLVVEIKHNDRHTEAQPILFFYTQKLNDQIMILQVNVKHALRNFLFR